MTTSRESLEDRLRRVLHEQAEALQVHPTEWQGATRTVAHRRSRRSRLFGGVAVGFGGGIVVLIVVGALVLLGHHNAGTKAGAGARSGAATTRSGPPATTRSGPPDCNAAGINGQELREGTCVSGANTVVVVNKTSTLHLKSLDANYLGFHRNGKFVTLTITIKNKLDMPQRWQHTMGALFIPGTGSGAGNGPDYLENLGAETGDQNSCLRKTGTAANGGLQPGASVRCDVVFDIPASADPAWSGSTLDIANFGDDVSNSSGPVGTIRTFH